MQFMHALWAAWLAPADPLLELAMALRQPLTQLALERVDQLQSWCSHCLEDLEQPWDEPDVLTERLTLAYSVLVQACEAFLAQPEEEAEGLVEVLEVASVAIADVREAVDGQLAVEVLLL